MKVASSEKEIILFFLARPVKHGQFILVRCAHHGPPRDHCLQAWLRQQDAVKCDLNRVIRETTLGVLVQGGEKSFRAGFPALSRRISLKGIKLLCQIISYVPHDFQGEGFSGDEVLVVGAILPFCRLCSAANERQVPKTISLLA